MTENIIRIDIKQNFKTLDYHSGNLVFYYILNIFNKKELNDQ
jgi:hypothetical protein